MSGRKYVTWVAIDAAARNLALEIRAQLPSIESLSELRLYGVPRGGVNAALAVARWLRDPDLVSDRIGIAPAPRDVRLVEESQHAHVIIDDMVDTGATMKRFNEQYPGKPFHYLFDKWAMADPGQWLVFPWEVEDEDAGPTENVRRLLAYVGENPNREGLLETPDRVIKAWDFWTKGYDEDPADILKTFSDGAERYDQMVVVRDIDVWSHCEHHLAPFFGVAHVAYIPDSKIVGLSKLARLVDCYARRLQVQERLTSQIADALVEHLMPRGVGVVLQCRHLCMESRGIQSRGAATVTSSLHGDLLAETAARAEFMSLLRT